MKKIYQKPTTEMMVVETQSMIALSQDKSEETVNRIDELDSRGFDDWDE